MLHDPIHVDIVMHRAGTPSKMFAYSAYMNEPFSMNLMNPSMMRDPTFDNLSLDITVKEYDSCVRYLSKLVDRARYNRSDAMFLLPIIPSKSSFSRVMVPDVDASKPELIKSVYCSQAVVLLIRECLKGRQHVQYAFDGINSRLTSPHDLYQRMRGICNPLVNEFFES